LRTLSIIDFLLRWEKDYQLLWEQPSGYKKPVLKDSINKPFVDWLLVSLREALETPERLITAGRYTEAVVQQVKQFQVLHQLTSDGVVGAKTIIHLQNYKSGQGRLNKTNVDVGST